MGSQKKDTRRTVYITCPHCLESIRMMVESAPKKKIIDWEAVDFGASTSMIARATGVTRSSVATARRKLAPETIGSNLPQKKYDWQAQDWRQPNGEIAHTLGTSASYVSTMRRQYAPGTLREREST